MKAYIVNYTGHNVDSLYKLHADAEPVILTEGNVPIFNTHRVLYDIKLKMMDSQEDDVLVLTGSIILNVLAASILMVKHGRVNMLIWHAKKECYMPRTIRKEDLA
jgi:hypothetical protein